MLPQVPTLAESGLKGFEATAWWALFAPAGLPPAVARAAERRDASGSSSAAPFATGCSTSACRRRPVAREPFAEFQRAEVAKWGRAVRDSGVTLE